MYSELVWTGLVACGVAVAATPLTMRLASKVGAVDCPADERRVHRRPTPRLGGVAACLGLLVASAAFINFGSATRGPERLEHEQLVAVLLGAASICFLGALDDVRNMRWYAKLAGQVGVALAVVFGPLLGPTTSSVEQLVLPIRRLDLPLVDPFQVPLVLGAAAVVVWVVTLMNVFNFIDGVDGLASGIAAIAATTFAIVGASYGRADVATVSAALAGACIGFLPWNFNRHGARSFLGDSGSMLLGYCLAVVSVQGVLKTAAAVSVVIPVALAAVPLLDTAFVVAKRVKYGIPVSSPDRWHLHHRLLEVGYTPRRVALTFWAWTAMMSALALTLRFVNYGNSNAWRREGLIVVGAVASLAVIWTLYVAIRLEIIKTPAVRERNRRARERAADSRSESDQHGGQAGPN